jgi:hypothetical protein
MTRYPIVDPARQIDNRRLVDVEKLSEQLIPIRDAFLKLFEGVHAKSRGEPHRLELGLTVTQQGNIAFAIGDTRPSLTLTLESRHRSPSDRSPRSKARAAKKPDVVEIDPAPPKSRVPDRGPSAEMEGVGSIVLDDM